MQLSELVMCVHEHVCIEMPHNCLNIIAAWLFD